MAKKKQRTRTGLLPGESRRRSLVSITRDTFTKESDQYGREVHNYVVSTRRLDGVWTHTIEYRGQTWELPGKVIERIMAQRDSIITEERSRRARERILAEAEKITK